MRHIVLHRPTETSSHGSGDPGTTDRHPQPSFDPGTGATAVRR
ncbi:hypothetical protein [Streptomyces sp. NBC_00690]|nr:hypothetical protein [Streptomyces sp. NBC_00690]